MAKSKIEWTEETWNPTTGCNKISTGCRFCYAEIMSARLKSMGQEKYENDFELTLHEDALKIPNSWKKPRIIFVNSMSDLFHKDVPLEFIQKVFKVMNDNPRHIFQVLTKRADLLLKYNDKLTWSENIWMGVSVEDANFYDRIKMLKKTGAKVKFLSLEPLIGACPNLPLKGIDWVIVGGESGNRSRQMKKEWVEDILNQCRKEKVKFFFKQWGGRNKKKTGRILNGKTFDEMPIRTLKIKNEYNQKGKLK
jgi:protein gp37